MTFVDMPSCPVCGRIASQCQCPSPNMPIADYVSPDRVAPIEPLTYWFCTHGIEHTVVGTYRTLAEAESNLFRGASIFVVKSATPPYVGTSLDDLNAEDLKTHLATFHGPEAVAEYEGTTPEFIHEVCEGVEALAIEMAARAAHEVNRTYCASHGDLSHDPWDHAREDLKNSTRSGVKAIMDQPSITPSELHNKWWQHKIADGWKYGPVKDADKKEHPCMVDYDELPPRDRFKDAIFHAVVRSHLQVDDGMKHATHEVGNSTP